VNRAARIMIVEDEPNVRLVFRMALESNDHTLTTAHDGEAALQWLEQYPVDLVLLDLHMPHMGGIELLRRLRGRGNGVPVIIITAHGTIPDVVQAVKLGAVDFLTKPLTPDALRQVVARVLKEHGFKSDSGPNPETPSASGRASLIENPNP
jgi:DNA-binding NtrC family response regulator